MTSFIATCEPIKPAPPVSRMFFGTYESLPSTVWPWLIVRAILDSPVAIF